ncbi:unnamed protein product [Rotaria sp. Silwood2]|nr:unnamed protein product [Rotaria sp. Silwood2]
MKDNFSIINWLARNLNNNSIVACDPQLVSISEWKEWERIFLQYNIYLISLEVNLIDLLWNDQRPSLPDTSICISNNEIQSSSNPGRGLRRLFDLRVVNIQFNSVFLSFALIGRDYVK